MKNYLVRNNTPQFFDDVFDSLFKPMFYDDFNGVMATDIKHAENGYVMEIEMPGVKKENISIDYEKGYLTVSSKSEEIDKENKNRYIRQERRTTARRSYYVGEINQDNIKAKYESGILTVELPKKEPEKQLNKKIVIE